MKNDDQLVTEVSSELAVAMLLMQKLEGNGSPERAKALIETFRSAVSGQTVGDDVHTRTDLRSAA